MSRPRNPGIAHPDCWEGYPQWQSVPATKNRIAQMKQPQGLIQGISWYFQPQRLESTCHKVGRKAKTTPNASESNWCPGSHGRCTAHVSGTSCGHRKKRTDHRCSIFFVESQQKNGTCGDEWRWMEMISGWWYTYPSEKYNFVSWDDDIPNWIERHKIPWFQLPPTKFIIPSINHY